MNILVFNWQDRKHPHAGGAEIHFHEIFGRIVREGHSVTLVCSRFRGGAPRDIIDGVRVIRIGNRSLFNFAVPLWYLFFGRRYDLVVDDVNKIPFYSPMFIRKPVVALFHHLFGKSVFLETNPIAASYVYLSEKIIPWFYSRVPVVAVSGSTRDELVEMGLSAENIQIIHNSVDHSVYRPAAKKESDIFTIGFLGRIKKYKSIDHLIEAFVRVREIVPEARLVIIGSGDHLRKLKKIASKTKYRNDITFTGYVSEDEKVEYIRNMDVIVNTSSKEGWGLTVIEANACGVPVIGANVPGLRDSIKDEETGLLYHYGDVEALTALLFRYYGDAELRRRLRARAIDWAAEFNWDNAASKFLRFFKESVYRWRYRKDLPQEQSRDNI
jgi:glycosyltransferase involved in cell wall biosynthesis